MKFALILGIPQGFKWWSTVYRAPVGLKLAVSVGFDEILEDQVVDEIDEASVCLLNANRNLKYRWKRLRPLQLPVMRRLASPLLVHLLPRPVIFHIGEATVIGFPICAAN